MYTWPSGLTASPSPASSPHRSTRSTAAARHRHHPEDPLARTGLEQAVDCDSGPAGGRWPRPGTRCGHQLRDHPSYFTSGGLGPRCHGRPLAAGARGSRTSARRVGSAGRPSVAGVLRYSEEGQFSLAGSQNLRVDQARPATREVAPGRRFESVHNGPPNPFIRIARESGPMLPWSTTRSPKARCCTSVASAPLPPALDLLAKELRRLLNRTGIG